MIYLIGTVLLRGTQVLRLAKTEVMHDLSECTFISFFVFSHS